MPLVGRSLYHWLDQGGPTSSGFDCPYTLLAILFELFGTMLQVTPRQERDDCFGQNAYFGRFELTYQPLIMKSMAHRHLTLLLALVMAMLVTACNTAKKATATASEPTKEMTKKMADPFTGTWDYVVANTPDGDAKGQMIIRQDGDSYSGMLKSEMGDTNINNLTITDNKLSGTFDFQGYELTISGDFEGSSFSGEVGVDYTTFPMTASKQSP